MGRIRSFLLLAVLTAAPFASATAGNDCCAVEADCCTPASACCLEAPSPSTGTLSSTPRLAALAQTVGPMALTATMLHVPVPAAGPMAAIEARARAAPTRDLSALCRYLL